MNRYSGTGSSLGELSADLGEHFSTFLSVFFGFGTVFAVVTKIMGRNLTQFLIGYTILFPGSPCNF